MTLDVLSRLACNLGRRDEVPNVALAEALAAKPDARAVATLVKHLADPTMAIRNDCIKVLYELGERRPEAIAPHAPVFLDLLQAKDNRMKWGAMSALSAVAPLAKDLLAKNLARVVAAAVAGSVITRDHAVRILAVLGADARHAKKAIPALLDQVLAAPVNQLPMYAELALPAIGAAHRARFLEILHARMRAPLPPAKQKRLGAVLHKAERIA